MIKSILQYFVAFILLSSCVSTKQSKVASDIEFSSSSRGGLVIGTVTFNYHKKKSPYDSYKFHLGYQSDDIEEVKKTSTYFNVNVNFFNGRFNGELNESKTFPFVLLQKPGVYNFNGFWFFWNGGMITKSYYNPVKFSLPFTVEKSKIVYIGNIVVNLKAENTAYIEITDQLSKDIGYFKKNYPNIDWNLTNNNTLKQGNDGNGFIKLSK